MDCFDCPLGIEINEYKCSGCGFSGTRHPPKTFITHFCASCGSSDLVLVPENHSTKIKVCAWCKVRLNYLGVCTAFGTGCGKSQLWGQPK